MTNMKNIAASLALACAAMTAQAADISLPDGSIDVIDGAGAFSRLITGNHSGDTFTDTYAFDVTGVSSLTANLYSNAGNANVGLDITGFSLYSGDGTLVSAGTQVSTGKFDQWSLDLSNVAGGTGYYVAVTGSVVSRAAGSYSGDLAISPVPEPATYGMLLGGMALVGVVARRRAQQK
ncbi:FxDxF family PEP-CTERM protein [Massilia sp. METH4]|uniref:FxDxF family PEP-CTERM protein n=1 Tax=Massilia sp. METH4 TaxID=3123041 RepID=UPI0030CC5D0F